MRTVSLTFREAMNSSQTGEVPIVLITINHPQLVAPIRLTSDPTQVYSYEPLQYGTVSRGMEFFFYPFNIKLPDDAEERAPSAQIQIENVSRLLVETIRSTTTPATVKLELVLSSSPNAVEIEWPDFMLTAVTYNDRVMTLNLAIDALVDVPYPSGSFDPASFPGLF